MEADEDVPILFGRPFLATAGTIIDMKKGKITLQLDDEVMEFDVYNAKKKDTPLAQVNSCKGITMNDSAKMVKKPSVGESSYKGMYFKESNNSYAKGDNEDPMSCALYSKPLRRNIEGDQFEVSNSSLELIMLMSDYVLDFYWKKYPPDNRRVQWRLVPPNDGPPL